MWGVMPKISRNVLSNKACTALKERIANHRFQPGMRLNVEKMAETLDNQEGVIQKGDLLGYSRSDRKIRRRAKRSYAAIIGTFKTRSRRRSNGWGER
jgi:hypothetical protein